MDRPFVSFVLPTLNAEPILADCLRSIRAQDYRSNCYEILVPDGGSRDRTADIAKEFGCTVLDAKGLLAEPSKQLAFAHASGRYIVMLDADNEIAQTDWLSRVIDAMEQHPEALGFESYYLKHPKDSHLNRYLTGLLQISDPIARSMSTPLKLLQSTPAGVEVFQLPADGSYPTGANGFVFRRELLDSAAGRRPYHEAAFFPALIREGMRTLIKIRGLGVYHHYVQGWKDYLRKRQRVMIVYSLRKEQIRETWDGESVSGRTLRAVLYHATLIGPAIEGLWHAITERDAEWLLHPAASMVSTAGHVMGVLQYRKLQSGKERIERAQHLHTDPAPRPTARKPE